MSHLLVTNDFPPKMGGIQTYLWELWRRLPPDDFAVLTTPFPGTAVWDRNQPFRVTRVRERVLLPRRVTAERIRQTAAETGAKLVVLDPALPLAALGPSLGLPYAVVLHGAEVTVPGRLPLLAPRLARVLTGARGLVAAGGYPLAEAARTAGGREALPDVVEVPPGVDLTRFTPIAGGEADRAEARRRLSLPQSGPLIVSASRLVPRKGMDVLIKSLPHLVPHRPDLTLAIAGGGRDLGRLKTIAGRLGVAKRVRFLGRVPEVDLASLYACADVFVMLCRNRWGGLEQEGFGIVFMEAAASGVAQIAGNSGGAPEAVVDGETGIVLDDPTDAELVAKTISELLDDPDRRRRMGHAGRERAVSQFDWDLLARRLHDALRGWEP